MDEQQLELDYPGAPPIGAGEGPEPLRVNYTKYAPGVALSEGVVLSACPKCGATGHRREYLKHTRWVHAVTIAGGKVKPVGMCKVPREDDL